MYTQLLLIIFTLTGSLMMTSPVRAEQKASQIMMPPTSLVASPVLENAEYNTHDKGNTTLTPKNQKETKKDIKITAKIRRAVVGDKSLSVDAQNAKIITRNGVVTLRGPVENEAEKSELQQIAIQTQYVVQVDNQLENKAP
jgi:osmotically-inducible protein OsmY